MGKLFNAYHVVISTIVGTLNMFRVKNVLIIGLNGMFRNLTSAGV